MKQLTYKYWSSSSPTLDSMTHIENTSTFNQAEKDEILSQLPSFQGKKVLELASGIGRFTGELAAQASHVDTVDFAPQFVEKNQEAHKHLTNITYHVANAMDLTYSEGTFDFIFINWLFMYLSDEETASLFKRLNTWLKKKGTLFFRESCAEEKHQIAGNYAALYRPIDEYSSLAKEHFHQMRHDIVLSYLIHHKLMNQHFWVCQKN